MEKKHDFLARLESTFAQSRSAKAWCNECRKYQLVKTEKRIRDFPNFLCFNTNLTSVEEGFIIPEKFRVSIGTDVTVSLDTDVEEPNSAIYELMATVDAIKMNTIHLVTHIRVEPSRWFLFNDFLVEPIPTEDVLSPKDWRVPVVLQYRKVSGDGIEVPLRSIQVSSLQKKTHIKYVFNLNE
jgi:PAB-dependent poly(A)-specific ribonuclease subunit 2